MKIVQFSDGTYGIRKFCIYDMRSKKFKFCHLFLCKSLYYHQNSLLINTWFEKEHEQADYRMSKEKVVERWEQRRLTLKKIAKQKIKKIEIGKPCKDSEFHDERIKFGFKSFLNSLAGRE